MSNVETSNPKPTIWEKIGEESELIAIFVLFLAILIAHETLVEIANKTTLIGIVNVWLVLLGSSLIFFIWVVRYGLNKTRNVLKNLLDERLNPLTDVLRVTARNIELDNLQGIVKGGVIQSESETLNLEATVDKSIWVCSPDFRFELGVMGAESYIDVIAGNLGRGIPYHYFVPLGQETIVEVERFSDGLEAALNRRSLEPSEVQAAMKLVDVVALSTEQYPATEALGSAVYQFKTGRDIYVGYFPSGQDGWNIILSNQAVDGVGSKWGQQITATLGRFYYLRTTALNSLPKNSQMKLNYYAKA